MADSDPELAALRTKAGEFFIASHNEKHAAHETLAEERWTAHRALHDDFDNLVNERWGGHRREHDAEDEARRIALGAMDKRLDSMNEFRDQLREQAATFVRREQLEEFISRYERAHDEVLGLVQTEREERRANEGSRRGSSSSIAWIIAAISAVGGILAIIIVVANALTALPK